MINTKIEENINLKRILQVFYRVALAILILFHKHTSNQNSEWYAEATKNGVDHAIDKFCRNMPVSPTKLLRTAFTIRALRLFDLFISLFYS